MSRWHVWGGAALLFLMAILLAYLATRAFYARGDDAPPCATPEACRFLDLALECQTQHRITKRELEGERAMFQRCLQTTRTASLTCASCPACECGSSWIPTALITAGGVAGCAAVCGMACGGDAVTVVR